MRSALGALIVLALVVATALSSGTRAPGRGAPRAIPSGTFTFDPSVDAASRQLIEQAIGSARPEAQRLIDTVDGLVTIRVGDTGPDAAGYTESDGDRYVVTLDIGSVMSTLGVRGVQRLVLHELGHVVDFVLVPQDLDDRLDAMIPAGLPCPAGTPLGSCAPEEERFAETFAKWAMFDDIGANLYIGYAVPPTDFDIWAAPIIPLAR